MKNNLFYTVIFSVLVLGGACTKKIASFYRTGEVTCQSHDRQTITLESLGAAEVLGKAIHFAERNIFENLLFKGIPNSNQETPIVEDELTALRNYDYYFKSLLKDRRYMNFVMDSYNLTQNQSKGLFYIRQQVKIDLHALKKDMEKEGVIRSFGI